MAPELAEMITDHVLSLKEKGVKDEDAVVRELIKVFKGNEEDFYVITDTINTGIFRAAIMSEGHSLPRSNRNTEDILLKTAFRKTWIHLKGEEHYLQHYASQHEKTRGLSFLKRWLKGKI